MYAFSVDQDGNWPYYPWDDGLLTTVCAFQGLDPQMVCRAHQSKVQVTVLAPYPKDQLHNAQYLASFISGQIAAAQAGNYDGINFDFEDPITTKSDANALTNVIASTAKAMKAALGDNFQVRDASQWVAVVTAYYQLLFYYFMAAIMATYFSVLQITADLAWSPDCIDRRCYDYQGIAAAVDYSFLMEYDLRSQVWPPAPCIAGSNDDLRLVTKAVSNWTQLIGVPPEKLILGVPFYGFDYACTNPNAPPHVIECTIEAVPYEGAPCSDAAGSPIGYMEVLDLLKDSTTGYIWDNVTSTPRFNYVAGGKTVHQVRGDHVKLNPIPFKLMYFQTHSGPIRRCGLMTHAR